MQTGSFETLIGLKSGQTTYVPLWDRIEGAWLWTLGGGKHLVWKTEGKAARLKMTTFAYCSIPFLLLILWNREVAKWEDRDNDIVALAKHMCRIMMDMADFIKGRGKLKTTQVGFHKNTNFNFTQT
jgi:hypothetical protein